MDLVQRNWTIRSAIGRLVLLFAVAVGLISLTHPWFFARYTCSSNEAPCPGVLPRSGLDIAGGFLFLFVLFNVMLLYMVRLGAGNDLVLPLADWWLYLSGGIGALGAASLSLLDPAFHDFVGFGVGFPLALAAAAAICVGAVFERTRQQKVGWSAPGAIGLIGLGVLYGVGLILLFTVRVPV
jgi:hypothetical protein